MGLGCGPGQAQCIIGTSPHGASCRAGMMTTASHFAGGVPTSITLGWHGHYPSTSFSLIFSVLVNPMIIFEWLPVLTVKIWPRNSRGLIDPSQGNEIKGHYYNNAHLLKSLRGQCGRTHKKPRDVCYPNRLVVEADKHIPNSASKLAIKGICKQTKQCYSLH